MKEWKLEAILIWGVFRNGKENGNGYIAGGYILTTAGSYYPILYEQLARLEVLQRLQEKETHFANF